MFAGITDGRRRGSRTSCVTQSCAGRHFFKQMVLHIEPGALILRFVLNPNHFGSEGVTGSLFTEALMRERIELFKANNDNVIDFMLFCGISRGRNNLTGADQNSSDLIGIELFNFTDDGFKFTFGEFFQIRTCHLVASKRLFGEKTIKGLRILPTI